MSQPPDPHRLLQQAKRLTTLDLNHLVESLVAEIEARKTSPSDEEGSLVDSAGWRSEYRKCGKPTCRCATSEHRHGPYLYRSVWVDGAVKKEYQRRSKRKAQDLSV
jgi:hypothetical protein